MNHNFAVEYERVKLVPLSAEDAEKMRVLRNKNSAKFFSHSEITAEDQQRWFRKYLDTPDDYMFSVYLKETNVWVGAVSIYNVESDLKTAEFGRILIDKDATAEYGLGVDTTIAACRFAFAQLQLTTLHLEVYSDNIPAVHTYIKAGFQEKGRTLSTNEKEIIYMTIHK